MALVLNPSEDQIAAIRATNRARGIKWTAAEAGVSVATVAKICAGEAVLRSCLEAVTRVATRP